MERIVFTVAFEEGDPVVTAISPSGARFSEGHPQVDVERDEWGMMLAVLDPEPGEWSVEVAGLINRESYEIEAYGTEAMAEVRVDTPAFGGERAEGSYVVRGLTSDAPAGTPVRIYLSHERDSYVGVPAAETTVDEDGAFQATIDTAGLEDGEYFLFAGSAIGENPESRAYAPGSLVVAHVGPLLPVERLIASDDGAGGVTISFHDPNGARTKGFQLYVERPDGGTSETIWLGYLTNTVVPGFEPGDQVRVSVAAVDAERREGPRSAAVTVTMGAPAPQANTFRVAGAAAVRSCSSGRRHGGACCAWRTTARGRPARPAITLRRACWRRPRDFPSASRGRCGTSPGR